MSQINQHGGGARRSAGRVLAGIAAGLALAAVAAAAPAAADAPWGFEQVTPVDKGAGTVSYVDTFRARPDGKALLYTANAPMAGIPTESSPLYTRYFATRGDDGWHNRGLDPRYTPVYPNFIAAIQNVAGVSADLSHAAVVTTRALTPGATEGGGNLYVRDTSTGALTLVATSANQRLTAIMLTNQGYLSVKYVGPDGSLLFSSPVSLVPGAPDGTIPSQFDKAALYRWTPEDGLEAASVLPGGTITDTGYAVGYGTETGIRDSLPQRDGLAHVYFTEGATGPVWVRSGDATRLVSRSHIGGGNQDPVPATVQATTDGGRYMLFSTRSDDRLTADTPSPSGSQFLYRYDYVNDELTYIATGNDWNLDQIIQMTQDGQTIAFLSPRAVAGAAVEDQQNIYVWRGGTVRYVATVDPGSSGASSTAALRRLSPSGRYLAYTDDSTSVAQRVGFGNNISRRCPPVFNDDPGPCKLVYLYDADTDRLVCASCRQDGLPPDGQAGDPLNKAAGFIRLSAYQVRTVTDDGTVFLTSPDPLVPEDANGADDVYSFRDGRFRLLSRATQGTNARFIDASEDGSTVFIATNDPILATDTDQAVDIYATRAGGGYPDNPPKVTPPCVESDCRAPGAPPAAPPVAGSVVFSAAGPAKIQRQSKAKLKAIAGSAGSLKVTVAGKGRITASGSGVRRVTRTVSRAATYTVRLSLTTAARRALKHSSTVRKTVKVTFTPSTGKASTATLSLTFKAPASSRKGR